MAHRSRWAMKPRTLLLWCVAFGAARSLADPSPVYLVEDINTAPLNAFSA
jgi:hypothetical protein